MPTLPVQPKSVFSFGNVQSMEQAANENPNLKPYAQAVAVDALQVKMNPTDLNAIKKYATDVATLAAYEGINGADPTQMAELQNGIVSSLQSEGVSLEDMNRAMPTSSAT